MPKTSKQTKRKADSPLKKVLSSETVSDHEDEDASKKTRSEKTFAEKVVSLCKADSMGYVNLFEGDFKMSVVRTPGTDAPTIKFKYADGREVMHSPPPPRPGKRASGFTKIKVFLPPCVLRAQYASPGYMARPKQGPFSQSEDDFSKAQQTLYLSIEDTLKCPRLQHEGKCVSESGLMQVLGLIHSFIPAELLRNENHAGGFDQTPESRRFVKQSDKPGVVDDAYRAVLARLNDRQKAPFTFFSNYPRVELKNGKDSVELQDDYVPVASDFVNDEDEDMGKPEIKLTTRAMFSSDTMDPATTEFLAKLPTSDPDAMEFLKKVEAQSPVELKLMKIIDEDGKMVGPETYCQTWNEIGPGSIVRPFCTLSIGATMTGGTGTRIDLYPQGIQLLHREGGYKKAGDVGASGGVFAGMNTV